MRRIAFLMIGLLLACAQPAHAYRPFDSTDADVAHEGELELELAPVGRLREGSKKFLVAPAVVANVGLSKERELVIQGQREVRLNPEPGDSHSALVDNGVFIKQVLREGVLQEGSGPSVATEYGVLLPSVNGHDRAGLSAALIASQRWKAATVHLNAAIAINRDHQREHFLGGIIEGPYSWPIRPVAELFTDQARGSARINSGLVGAIWRMRDGLSFDLGVRYAQAGAVPIHEFRVGLTWAFPLKGEQ